MAIGSIGSTPSFWQQDQSYWSNAQNESAAQSADASLINVMASAETNLGKGLASIANGEALTRTKSQLTSAIQAVLQGTSGSSTTTSSSATGSTTSSSGTSSSAASSPTPATGTGTVPLTTTTPLATLGILPGGTFSIDDGTNITNYTSTGDDTVASLISAINSGPAFVTASLNPSGHLTITARNTKDLVTVEGSGNDATALGFGTGNNSFTPKVPKTSSASTTSSPSSTSSTSSSASASSSTSKSSKSTSSSSSTAVSSIGEEISSSAASILSASGVSGTLVDMLA